MLANLAEIVIVCPYCFANIHRDILISRGKFSAKFELLFLILALKLYFTYTSVAVLVAVKLSVLALTS